MEYSRTYCAGAEQAGGSGSGVLQRKCRGRPSVVGVRLYHGARTGCVRTGRLFNSEPQLTQDWVVKPGPYVFSFSPEFSSNIPGEAVRISGKSRTRGPVSSGRAGGSSPPSVRNAAMWMAQDPGMIVPESMRSSGKITGPFRPGISAAGMQGQNFSFRMPGCRLQYGGHG